MTAQEYDEHRHDGCRARGCDERVEQDLQGLMHGAADLVDQAKLFSAGSDTALIAQ
jgi:hypothetical protein